MSMYSSQARTTRVTRSLCLYLPLLSSMLFTEGPLAQDAPPALDASQPSSTSPSSIEANSPLKGERLPFIPAEAPPNDPALLKVARSIMSEPGALPRLKLKGEEEHLTLPLKKTNVSAEITGAFVSVEVTQVYYNHFDRPIEAIYTFPLPENSAVDGMRIQIEDRIIDAKIHRRKVAKKIYELAKSKGKTAALLEQERPNIFTQSIANIAPHAEVRVSVHYLQQLSVDGGAYELVFPMVVGERFIPGRSTDSAEEAQAERSSSDDQVSDASRINPPVLGHGTRTGHDISLEVTINAGLPIRDLTVPTHETQAYHQGAGVLVRLVDHDSIPNRDFVLRYRLDQPQVQATTLSHYRTSKTRSSSTPQAQQDPETQHGSTEVSHNSSISLEGGYFSMIVTPPRVDLDQVVGRRELIFVLDVSGSMLGDPLGLSKIAMRKALKLMRPTDTFNVYTFAGRTGQLFKRPRPVNQTSIKTALQFIDGLEAGGGTMLSHAVKRALTPSPQGDRHRYVLFLTDGLIGNEKAIFKKIRILLKKQKKSGVIGRVFSFGVGSAPNRYLLNKIAKIGRGSAQYATTIKDPQRAINHLFKQIDSPILTDLKISWSGLEIDRVTPMELPDLFASQPLVIYGRYKTLGVGSVTLSGTQGQAPFSLTLPLHFTADQGANEGLASMWARAQVERLEELQWMSDQGSPAQITDLGLAYSIVTQYTSFVAVDHLGQRVESAPLQLVQPVESTLQGYGGLGAMGRGVGGGGISFGSRGSIGLAHGVGRLDGSAQITLQRERRPRVIPLKIKVLEGVLSDKIIHRVIRSRLGPLHSCYKRQLASKPDLRGEIELLIGLSGSTGVVLSVKVSSNTINSPALERCMIKVVRKLRFPKVKRQGDISIRSSFKFTIAK